MTALESFSPKPGRVCVYGTLGYDVVRQSKNLAAVLRQARKSPVTVIELRDLGTGFYGVAFHFDDRSSALTTWSDWRVVCDWINARRSWGVDRINIDPDLWEAARARLQPTLKRGTIVHARRIAA